MAAYDADLKKKKDAIALKQFKEDQDMAIAKTIMNAGVAIMKIWAADNVDTPLAIIQSALVSGVAVGELATIEAQQPPSYATGTEYINGPGTGTSDSIWARVSKGERIVPAAINAELGGISNVDLPKLNYAAVMNAMRSNTTALNGGGGFVSNTTAAQGNNDLMASLHKSISQLNEHIANGIVAHTEIGQHNEAVYKYNKLVARSGAVNKVVMDYDKG